MVTYDQFVGDSNCIYVVVVSMKDSPTERKRQLHFWLDYLRSHMTLVEPIGKYSTLHDSILNDFHALPALSLAHN